MTAPSTTGHESTILIKTFERPWAVRRCLASLAATGWTGPVMVLDDSRTSCRKVTDKLALPFELRLVETEYNIGTSAGRNRLLELTDTPYFFLFDDDFVCTPELFRPAFMLQVLTEHKLDILAGRVVDRIDPFWAFVDAYGRKNILRGLFSSGFAATARTLMRRKKERIFFGNFRERDKTMHVDFFEPETSLVRCDLVCNFFVAKTESVQGMNGWDKDLTPYEHNDFFLRAKKAGLQVAATREAGILHRRHPSLTQILANPFSHARYRANRYVDLGEIRQRYLSKFGLRDWENF